MLTRQQSLAVRDFQRRLIIPDRLNQKTHANYPDLAAQMLQIYRTGIGQRRKDLHREIHRIFEQQPDTPLRRIEAFCRLLDDASVYASSERRNAAELRRSVFREAAQFHPLVTSRDRLFENSAAEVQNAIAQRLQQSWDEISDNLFADVIEFHRLESFSGFAEPRDLLSRYNVAQIQATLFSAVSLTVNAGSDFKRILRAARLAKLMHTINRIENDRWQIHLTGPASVLRETRRYGVNFAQFLPALICCRDWQLAAMIENRGLSSLRLLLSSDDGLRSHLPPDSEFDSSVEAAFAEKWGSAERDGWKLLREAEILHAGQKTFIPDFVLQHASGCRALLEIIGFWTPEYLQHRTQTLETFQHVPIILAIPESTAQKFEAQAPTAAIVTYKSALLVKQILDVLPPIAAD